jgi:glyoxylase-like metal-dependent hydrolase (beta-lactamase superfamily II)
MVKNKTYDFIHERVLIIKDRTFPVYIILGEKNILVDAGPAARAPELIDTISGILKETGDANGQRIDTLLLTHSHWDHVGGAFHLQERFGFDVLASNRTIELLSKPKVIKSIDSMNQGYKSLIRDRSNTRFSGLKQMRPLAAKTSIRLDSQSELNVFEVPGHTKCSMAFFLTPGNILFPGDATGLREPDGTIRPLFFSSFSEYIKSIRALNKLGPDVLALPHNRPLKGKDRVRAYLDASLLKTEEVREAIMEFLDQGLDAVRTAEMIYEREFPNISFMGPRKLLIMNLESMVRSICHEIPGPK